MSRSFSKADVAGHCKADDLYIIIDDDVYDLSTFADEHPGKRESSRVRNCAFADRLSRR